MRARSSVSPEPIGIGCSAMPSHLGVLGLVADVIDLVEVSPEALTRELPSSELSMPRARLDRDLVDPVLAACGRLPVISHGMELSIGTAAGWNHESLSVLDDFGRTVDYRWHSEHIGFTSAPDRDGIVRGVGLPLPLPFTTEVADMVAARADCSPSCTRSMTLLETAAKIMAYMAASMPKMRPAEPMMAALVTRRAFSMARAVWFARVERRAISSGV